ncbi:MAG TPA: sporulation transcription factor Spo0A [Clostridiales bacterium]|nr:sporulation transcription factor Spo0A [Clostridiales bacterium]
MKDISIVIVDDDPEFSASVKLFFAGERGYQVLATATSGREGVEEILRRSPDVVLLDMILPETDGFEVMSEARLGGSRAKFIVLSAIGGDEYAARAIKNGASHYMLKPISFLSLKNRIDEIAGGNLPSPAPLRLVQNRMLDERITNIFISVGIPAHIKGYQFLREAIKMAVACPDIINSITKRLYPEVADRFDTSASKVERAIRHAIEVAWNKGKIENINQIFGVKVYSGNEKPTNGEFIALVADKMLIECA